MNFYFLRWNSHLGLSERKEPKRASKWHCRNSTPGGTTTIEHGDRPFSSPASPLSFFRRFLLFCLHSHFTFENLSNWVVAHSESSWTREVSSAWARQRSQSCKEGRGDIIEGLQLHSDAGWMEWQIELHYNEANLSSLRDIPKWIGQSHLEWTCGSSGSRVTTGCTNRAELGASLSQGVPTRLAGAEALPSNTFGRKASIDALHIRNTMTISHST